MRKVTLRGAKGRRRLKREGQADDGLTVWQVKVVLTRPSGDTEQHKVQTCIGQAEAYRVRNRLLGLKVNHAA